MQEWTDDMLDLFRVRGDPPVDELLARWAAESEGDSDAHTTLRHMAASFHSPGPSRSPIDRWLAEPSPLPAWADPELIAQGQAVFHRHGLLIGTMLYCASLPEAYASAKGAKALWLTGSLVTTTDRRINETAQFLIDTLEPGGLARQTGLGAIRRVRLMHAMVRWLIASDPRVSKVDDDDATGWCWSSTWGTPVNQEELLGTLLSFTTVVFGALDRLGVTLAPQEQEAYLHTWCVVGYLLGIEPDVLPFDVASARRLQAMIGARMQAPSEEGRALEAALLSSTSAMLPRPLRTVPLRLTRRCASPEALAILGLGGPPPGRQRRWLGPLAAVEQRIDPVRILAEWTSTELLRGLVRAGRGSRPPFALPASLGEAWGVDPRSPRLRSGIDVITKAAGSAARGTGAGRAGPPPT